MKVKREFKCQGFLFHLNDVPARSVHREFLGRYYLMIWDEVYERWTHVSSFDTKKQAVEFIKQRRKEFLRFKKTMEV